MASIADNLLLTPHEFSKQMHEVLPTSELNGTITYSAKLMNGIARIAEIQAEITRVEGAKNKNPVRLRKLSRDLGAIESKVDKAREKAIRDFYRLYTNAYKAELPIILGGEALRGIRASEEMQNFGVLSGGTHQAPRSIVAQIPDTITGSILCDGSWCILKNDAGMLGAIHSGKTFYGSGGLPDEDLWDALKDRPKVMGREIAMLYGAGYRQVATEDQMAKFGATFVCLDEEVASHIALRELIEEAEKISGLVEIRNMLDPDNDGQD